MGCQNYHGHSFEVSFREISCGLQGMEVFKTLPQHVGGKAPEYAAWKIEHDKLHETSLRALSGSTYRYNTLDYRWRRRECKVMEVRTGRVKYVPLSIDYWWEPDDFVYTTDHLCQRRLQRVIIALDAKLVLTDPTYRLQERMARAGIRKGFLQWDEFVHEDIIDQLEAHVTAAQWQFLRTHFPWLMD